MIFNIWTISPIGIGISGKMFLKRILLEELLENVKKKISGMKCYLG